MTTITTNENVYLSRFERFEEEADGKSPSWLRAIRRSAISHFVELGFPTTDDEEWRFTPVAAIESRPFQPSLQASASVPTAQAIERFGFGGLKCHRLIFVDGFYSAALSSTGPGAGGATLGSLAEAVTAGGAVLEKHLARHARSDGNAFTALNTAFFQDGAFVHIPKGVVVPQPILLLFISTAREEGATSHPRNLIIAERDSKATIIESYVSMVDAPYLTNAVTELVLDENAHVEHCRVQRESLDAFHVARVEAHQGRASNLLSHSIAIGARLARNDIHVVLDAEGCQSLLNGLYVAKGEQLIDHHTVIDHAKPRCESHEFYNGVLDEHARGVFNGKIFVRPDAQKTDAKQTSRALLLSDDAMVDAKPQLEIFADDVKCTHGATVGQLDEDAIFYLRARGIGLREAREMLIIAFAGEILDRITVKPVRAELDQFLTDRLGRKDLRR